MSLFLRAQDSVQVVTYMLVAFNRNAVLHWNDDRAYYLNSGLMNDVVSRGWPKDERSP
jgi:hypothetical protein